MTELTTCPSCGEKLKSGVFSSNNLIENHDAAILKEYKNIDKVLCQKCGADELNECKALLAQEINDLKNELNKNVGEILIISAQAPTNWIYEVVSLVSGQSVTGTGAVSEFTSSFTDFFGGQSGRFNKKLAAGEEICKAQLRAKCLDLGGNAIIATDIDYSEVGGDKGMLMVCMAGTVINLKNTETLGKLKQLTINNITAKWNRLKSLESL